MKFILGCLILSLSLSVTAKNLGKKQQVEKIKSIAKETRREFHLAGYTEISTTKPRLLTRRELIDLYFEHQRNAREGYNLNQQEISSLFKCHYSKSCALWNFNLSSLFEEDLELTKYFILLNIKNEKFRKYFFISH